MCVHVCICVYVYQCMCLYVCCVYACVSVGQSLMAGQTVDGAVSGVRGWL